MHLDGRVPARCAQPDALGSPGFQGTLYRPGEICQFDLWKPSRPIPVGHGQERRGYVVVACLGYSRAGSGALVFSKAADDIL